MDQENDRRPLTKIEKIDICPRCSERLMAYRCKLQCPRCGYTEDCSDAGLIDHDRQLARPKRGPLYAKRASQISTLDK